MKGYKIFGIGLSRTGTTTLNLILKQLGYNSMHFIDELLDPPDWSIIERGESFIDSPIPMLFKECDKRFRKSKFILTTRNINDWLDSMKWMFSHGKVIWGWDENIHRYHEMFYGTRKYDREIFESHWNRYHDDVFNYFQGRSSDLIVINIDEAFNIRNLCSFLQIPKQGVEIMKTNTRMYATVYRRVKYFFRTR